MTQTLILHGKPDVFGRQAVYIRYSDRQKRTLRKTKLSLKKEQFDRFKCGAPLKSELALYKSFLSCMDGTEAVGTTNFFKYVEQCVREWEKDKSFETHRQYQGEVSKLKTFRSDFTLEDVTPLFLKQYKEFCYGRGNTTNTVWKSFKFLRLIVRKALREQLIELDPFQIFDMPKYHDPKKEYLTLDQVAAIEELLTKPLPEELRFVAGWFLISCYSGLRFGDLSKFDKKKNIVGGRLIVHTSKTKEIVSMPLSPKLKDLFAMVKYKPLHYTNQTYNKYLKQIGGLAEIETPLTAHIARHTFAVMCANKGISQEVTAKLLGHQKLQTTAIYYKITNHRIDDELKKLG